MSFLLEQKGHFKSGVQVKMGIFASISNSLSLGGLFVGLNGRVVDGILP